MSDFFQFCVCMLSCARDDPQEVSYDELCRQLAFRAAGDVGSFDVVRLAYSTMTYYSVCKQLAGTAGIQANAEDESGDDPAGGALFKGGPLDGTVVSAPNTKLVSCALDAIFGEQQANDGLWASGQPIFLKAKVSPSRAKVNVAMTSTCCPASARLTRRACVSGTNCCSSSR